MILGHGLLMVCLGVALLCAGSIMSDPVFVAPGYDAAIALTVLGLLVPGVFFWFLPQRISRRSQMIVNLVVGSSLIGCWFILWLLQSGPSDVLFLVQLAGLHGVLWSMWYMKLAFTFQENSKKAPFLCVLAATTSFPGIILAIQSTISKFIAWYALFIGMQILLTYTYLYREGRAETDLQAERILQELPMAKESRIPLTSRVGNRGEPIEDGMGMGVD